MNILQFDSVGGASGDMILAALIDLGVSRDELQAVISRLPCEPVTIETEPVTDQGIRGLRVQVHAPAHNQPAHPHRGLAEIQVLIESSGLPAPVQAVSWRVFQRLAEAEALVHGTTPEHIHFHEVGALDSLVDIIGACWAQHRLQADGVVVGPLPLGQGTVACAHGILPVPAPATVELLKGCPIAPADEPFELVTPTGAALLSTWKTTEHPPPGCRLVRAGYGFGHRKLNQRPNLLRALLLETEPAAPALDAAVVLECNLDDCVPELLGSLFQRLLEAGAQDVWVTPVQMKKQRPGQVLNVICQPEQRPALLDLIFRESTTFGIREYAVKRTILARRFAEVTTPFGKIRVKIGQWQGQDVTWAPEYEDCLQAATAAHVSVRAVYEAALHTLRHGA